jgi:hypothetical protein
MENLNIKRPAGKMAQIVTPEFVRESGRDYNPTEWDKIIDRYLGYENVQFYFIAAGNGYGYDRYFVKYTSNGYNWFKSVCYSSTLSAGNFAEVIFFDCDNEFNKHPEGWIEINLTKFFVPNNPAGREYIADNSKKHGYVYTNEGV